MRNRSAVVLIPGVLLACSAHESTVDLTDVNARLASLEETTASLQADLVTQEAENAELSETITGLEAEIAALRDVDIDGLSDGIAQNAEDIAANTSAIEGLGTLEAYGPILYGNYTIENTIDLQLLSGVEEITGALYIASTAGLLSLDGIETLTTIGGDLNISYNSSLENVDGLAGLTTVGGSMEIYTNAYLKDVDGLSTLTSVGNNVYVYGNESLCQSSVDSILTGVSVGGTTYADGNDAGC